MPKPIWERHVDHLISAIQRENARKVGRLLREKSIKHKLYGLEFRAHLPANDARYDAR